MAGWSDAFFLMYVLLISQPLLTANTYLNAVCYILTLKPVIDSTMTVSSPQVDRGNYRSIYSPLEQCNSDMMVPRATRSTKTLELSC